MHTTVSQVNSSFSLESLEFTVKTKEMFSVNTITVNESLGK